MCVFSGLPEPLIWCIAGSGQLAAPAPVLLQERVYNLQTYGLFLNILRTSEVIDFKK